MTRHHLGFALALLVALLVGDSGLAVAQSGGSYRITKHVIAAGGGKAAAGPYAVEGTVGQPAAGVQQGGAYKLDGGFQTPNGSPAGGDALFQNGFE